MFIGEKKLQKFFVIHYEIKKFTLKINRMNAIYSKVDINFNLV